MTRRFSFGHRYVVFSDPNGPRLEFLTNSMRFLQPRPLNAVGVHRDQRNHDQSFKCYAALYEEPTLPHVSTRYTGGRYIRHCLIRYYPIDRTASVAVHNETRRLDQRNSNGNGNRNFPEGADQTLPSLFSSEFLKERHLCQKYVPKGSAPRSGSLLAGSVMEPSDFSSVPRTGKALEFVYQKSFYERPMIEVGGKRFTVQDSSILVTHRADASSQEISDASLSAALLLSSQEPRRRKKTADAASVESGKAPGHHSVDAGPDGYPVVWMKYSVKQDDSTKYEVKSYRLSFVRAALLVTSARQEAQLQVGGD